MEELKYVPWLGEEFFKPILEEYPEETEEFIIEKYKYPRVNQL